MNSNRLDDCLAELKHKNQKAFVAFIMAGDPDLATSQTLLNALPEAGADIIELGMPFTDPMADGPAIQAAGLRALKAKQTMPKTLSLVKNFRKKNQATPILLMGYYNPIYQYGVERFIKDATAAGVDGLIMVDLPAEEDAELCEPAREKGLHFIRLATPTTTAERLKTILPNASGFLYYVSIAGITGTKTPDTKQVKAAVNNLQKSSPLPVMVGFGIRGPEAAQEIASFADGVVVGTALVETLAATPNKEKAIENTLALAKKIANAVHK